jgi:hypothetical protein
MSIAEMRAVIARIDVSNLPITIELSVVDPNEFAEEGDLAPTDALAELRCVFYVDNVDTGKSAAFAIALPIVEQTEFYLLERARELIFCVLAHEIDERLYVDGKRRWDPHPSLDGQRLSYVQLQFPARFRDTAA